VSPLRAARLARGATQEQIVAALDAVSASGSSGVTASMLSGWELGRHVTSPRYRIMLSALFAAPAEVLFAHQDGASDASGELVLLAGPGMLREAMLGVVERAEEVLMVTGSRSRDRPYLEAIEGRLAAVPELVHCRVLFGPPRRPALREHLSRLLRMRDPEDRSLGVKTLCLGIIDDPGAYPERYLCVSEREAVTPIPSLTSADGFDCGVRLGSHAAARLVEHVRQCYAASRKIETEAAVAALPVPWPRPGLI
jgi:transcriptional regulator with XRE-family HTH domain